MKKEVIALFNSVKLLYATELGALPKANGNRRTVKDEYITCLVAVAWVLERRGYLIKWSHNDNYPRCTINGAYYDNSMYGSPYGYRSSELFIIYDTYLRNDHESTDFISAFSISNGGAIFPYGPEE